MKRWIAVICGAVLVGVSDRAIAQPRTSPADSSRGLFVAGSLFGDLKRFSSDDTSQPLDGSALGGEARVGTFLASRWSVEFDIGLSRATTSSQSLVQVPASTPTIGGSSPVPGQIRSSVMNRPLAASAVVGYRTSISGRVAARFIGGISFLHFTRELQTFAVSGATGPGVPGSSNATPSAGVIIPAPASQVDRQTDNLPAALVGIEAPVALATRWALVPEFRATAFGSNRGQPGGVFLRPGVGLRWSR